MNVSRKKLCKIISAVLFVGFLWPVFVSCQEKRKYELPFESLVIQKADGSSATVKAELAVKPEERNYGFMNRKNIPSGTGMLFVFDHDQYLDFWMKNTPSPLSIAYIGSNGVIYNLLDMKPFSTDNVSSTRYVRFALEVPQGWFAEQGIKTGDSVTFADGSPLISRW